MNSVLHNENTVLPPRHNSTIFPNSNSVASTKSTFNYKNSITNKVGSAFVLQYFQKAKSNPTELSRFYALGSQACRVYPSASGITTYQHALGVDQINSLLTREFDNQPQINFVLIRQLQCQESVSGSVLVSLCGTFNYKDGSKVNFHQSTVLVFKQDNGKDGYLIANDILIYESSLPPKISEQVPFANLIRTYPTTDMKNQPGVTTEETFKTVPQKEITTMPANGPAVLYTISPYEFGNTAEIPIKTYNVIKNVPISKKVPFKIPNIVDLDKDMIQQQQQQQAPIISTNILNPATPSFIPSQLPKNKLLIDSTAPSTNSVQSTIASVEKNLVKTEKTDQISYSKIVKNNEVECVETKLEIKTTKVMEVPKKSFAEVLSLPQNKLKKTSEENKTTNPLLKQANIVSSKEPDMKKLNHLNYNSHIEQHGSSQLNNPDRAMLISDRSNITEPSNDLRNTNRSNKSNYKNTDQSYYNNSHKKFSNSNGEYNVNNKTNHHNGESNSHMYNVKRYKPQNDTRSLIVQFPKDFKPEKLKEILTDHLKNNNIQGAILNIAYNMNNSTVKVDSEETAKRLLDSQLIINDKLIKMKLRGSGGSNGRHSPNNGQKREIIYNSGSSNNRQQKQFIPNNNTYQQRQGNVGMNNINNNNNSGNNNNSNLSNNNNNPSNYQKSSSSAFNISSCTTDEGWHQAHTKKKSKTSNRSNLSKKSVPRGAKLFETSSAPLTQVV